jgi:hypothetical protein
VCVLIGAGLSSIRSDGERRLVLATLGKGSISLMEVRAVVVKQPNVGHEGQLEAVGRKLSPRWKG